jgi:shikimate dehydrogenase
MSEFLSSDPQDEQGGSERLAVLGDPVVHSLSPPMHNAALRHLHLPYRYGRRHVPAGELAETFRRLRDADYLGWNLTLPHKIAALDLLDAIDPIAERLGATNTIVNQTGRLFGFNTDGPGLVAAISEAFDCNLKALRVAVFGAGGGAGRAAARYLADLGVRELFIVNRTVARIETLAEELGPSVPVRVARWENIGEVFGQADLIVNASSLGLDDAELNWPVEWVRPNHLVFDMVYGANETPLVRWARANGAQAIDGLLMLLHQGVLAFELWFGKPAPSLIMRRALFRVAGRANSPGNTFGR